MKGDITYNEALDLSIDRKNTIDVDRLFTLAELYFDGGHERLDEIRQILKKVNTVNEDFKRLYKSGPPLPGKMSPLSIAKLASPEVV
jgi:hypothetical protein